MLSAWRCGEWGGGIWDLGPIDSTPSTRSLVGRYLEDELHQAERILTLYRPWKRALQALREYLSASGADPFGERVDGGGRGVPVAQRIVEALEGDREYRRISQNVALVEAALSRLSLRDRDFAVAVWLDGLGVRRVSELLGMQPSEAETLRVRVLEAMMPDLCQADDILVRANVAEWAVEGGGGGRSASDRGRSCGTGSAQLSAGVEDRCSHRGGDRWTRIRANN